MVVHVFGKGEFEVDIEPSDDSGTENEPMTFDEMANKLDNMYMEDPDEDAQSTTAASVATTTDVGTVAGSEKGTGKGKAKGNEKGNEKGPEKGKGKADATTK